MSLTNAVDLIIDVNDATTVMSDVIIDSGDTIIDVNGVITDADDINLNYDAKTFE